MNDRTKVDWLEVNYQKILECEKLGHEVAKPSKTQGIMAALALSDRRFAESGWQNEPVEVLLAQLDPDQVAALKKFKDERGL